MASAKMEAKAAQLVLQQRVRFTRADANGCVATVAGDSGDYTVTLAGRWSCTCEHGCYSRSLCSHALATQAIYRAVVTALGGKQ